MHLLILLMRFKHRSCCQHKNTQLIMLINQCQSVNQSMFTFMAYRFILGVKHTPVERWCSCNWYPELLIRTCTTCTTAVEVFADVDWIERHSGILRHMFENDDKQLICWQKRTKLSRQLNNIATQTLVKIKSSTHSYQGWDSNLNCIYKEHIKCSILK